MREHETLRFYADMNMTICVVCTQLNPTGECPGIVPIDDPKFDDDGVPYRQEDVTSHGEV